MIGGEGYCKSAYNCQWIRDKQIHEKHWTFCNPNSDLICCKDVKYALYDKLDCHTNTRGIFSEQTLEKCIKQKGDAKDDSNQRIKSKLSYETIFYTDEQCKTLYDEHQRLEAIEDFIQGVAHGVDAEPGEFPFMVAILTQQPDGEYRRDCGGTIITKR